MEEIVKILMRRDSITENEAWNLVEECIEELQHCDNIFDAADIIADYLGLEPDYLDYLL